MTFSVTKDPAKPNVAIIALSGDLDASNYQHLIQRAGDLYKEGTRVLILDLADTEFVSSSGLLAIHSAALLMQGQTPPNPEDGWGAIHAMQQGAGDKARQCLKLVNPQPRVAATLDKVGFSADLEIYPSVDAALAAI